MDAPRTLRRHKPGRTARHPPGNAGAHGHRDSLPPPGQVRRLLKPRQRQVLRLLAHGLSNKEIAARLRLHPRTVALHMAALKEFFGASSPAQSVKRAEEMGMVEEQAGD
jgi:DNA-binding NarL/FixJ family response regulator